MKEEERDKRLKYTKERSKTRYLPGKSMVRSPLLTSQKRSAPSWCPDTASTLFEPTSTQLQVELCLKVTVWRYVLARMSQTFNDRSADPEMTVCPSPKNFTQVTFCACPTRWWIYKRRCKSISWWEPWHAGRPIKWRKKGKKNLPFVLFWHSIRGKSCHC